MLVENDMIKASCAMIGFGPANLGLLVAAIRRGEISELARNGLVIVDANQTLGSGSIANYRITANSLVEVFLECIEDPRLGELFIHLTENEAVKRFKNSLGQAPKLQDVAIILEAMADAVLSHLNQNHNVTVMTNTTATGWRTVDGRHVFELSSESKVIHLDTKWAFVNCGGQNRQAMHGNAAKVLTSHKLLTLPDATLNSVIQKNTDAMRVCIMGGSHSAISCAQRLTYAGLKGNIDIYGRTPLRLFYLSVEDAHLDEYSFENPLDVCPLSGRVNRFGGLRYDAHAAARNILKIGRICDTGPTVQVFTTQDPAKAVSAQPRYDLLVAATGYEAAGPCGPTLHSEADGRVRTTNGRIIPGLYSFGLGSGLVPSIRIGGETSFKGRLDGVWLYQNDIGDEVLNAFATDKLALQGA